jgi:uncharacterized iron-regulated membrane protein
MQQRKKQASRLRLFREIHRKTGAILFVFFFVISITSLLLGWKKNSNGLISPATEKGISSNLEDWMTMDTLQTIAFKSLRTSIDESINLELKKIDVRPDKGVVKFIFDRHYWEVQVDGTTGKVLAIAQRRSDFIEDIHDSSILDKWLGTNSDVLKLIYTSITGTALLLFTVTGFWLWYGPKKMRKSKRG